MSLRLRQAALLAGILIAGLVFGAPGVGGQQPVPTVPPTPPGPPPGIEVPLRRPVEPEAPFDESAQPVESFVTEALAPTISSGFDGVGQESDSDNFIHSPPDTHAAVGPNSIVEVTNGHVAIYDKTGGVIAGGDTGGGAVDLDAFCQSTDCFDPKVIYDQEGGRFVAVMPEGFRANESFLHIMVSKTSTPTNLTTDWDRFRHAAGTSIGPGGPGFFDYPGLGVSPDAVVVTGNLFSNCCFLGTKIRVFDKADLYDGDTTVNFVDIDRPGSQGATVQPAHHFGSPPANTFYLLQRWNATNLNVLVLTGLPGSPSLSTQLLGTSDQGACVSSAPQQGTSKRIDTVCTRMMNSVWRDGSLWGTNTGANGADSRTIVQWFEVETNDFPSGTPFLRQHGVIDGGTTEETDEFTYMPSISVDACNNAALTYTQSSSSRFPEMRYTGRLFGDTLNAMQTPVIAKASAFFFDDFTGPPERWGDYSATVIDPVDQSFWVAHEYAKVAASGGGNNGRWGTWFANFSFGCSPVDIALTTNGSVAFGVQALTVTVDTTGSGINDVETVRVTTGPADLLIKSTAFSDGGNTWTLGAASGADQVKWEFSADGSTWTTFTSAGTLFTLASAVAETATQDVFFRLTMPTSTASANEHGATVTIVAVTP